MYLIEKINKSNLSKSSPNIPIFYYEDKDKNKYYKNLINGITTCIPSYTNKTFLRSGKGDNAEQAYCNMAKCDKIPKRLRSK